MAFRSGAAVKDTDMGLGDIKEQVKLLSNSYVLVGFQEGSKTKSETKGDRQKKGGLSMPQIAAANEFGAPGVPARPFMSTSFDENKAQINLAVLGEYRKILDGKSTTKKSLGILGQFMVGMIQRKIRSIYFPPNSARTIAIKKSSKPLIDFGQMIQSVREKVVIKK